VPLGSTDSSLSSIRSSHVSAKAWDQVGGQWGAVAGGAFAGLAVGVVMATLGAALGLSASAATADHASAYTVTADGVQGAAVGFGIGAGIWLLLSAAVIGIAGGGVLAKMSLADRAYAPGVHGFVTWALGLTIAVLLAVSGASGLGAGVGAVAAGAAAHAPNAIRSFDGTSASLDARGNDARGNDTRSSAGRPADASLSRNGTILTPEERAAAIDAAETAATAAAMAAWFALVAQLVGLGATLWAASRRKFEPDGVVVRHA